MKKTVMVVLSALALALISTVAFAQAQWKAIKEILSGYQEHVLALSTPGTGTFSAKIDDHAEEISYELSYADLEGSINQAHIHFGERWQAGGISVFLCTNLGNGPAGTRLCPAAPATITGTLTPADVIGPAAQGIEAGEFDELLDAMRNSATYVNVHTSKYPAGEIRAHIH